MTPGVPQMSVLRHLMYDVYVNDIDTNLHNHTVLKYANNIEMKLLDSMHHISLLQSDMDTTQQGICDCKLKFAVVECVSTHFWGKSQYFPTPSATPISRRLPVKAI